MIDITLVAGRRPDLLRETLVSFNRWCFPNFQFGNIFANIDPFCGTDNDGDLCEELIIHYFPNASITRPENPSLGQAVKTLWGKIESPYALHLEDDWLLLGPLTPDRVFPLFTGQTKMVTLMNAQNNPKRGNKRKRAKITGVVISDVVKNNVRYCVGCKRIRFIPTLFIPKHPIFATSPSFIDGVFARDYAQLIDPNRDPEKQNRWNGGNPAIFSYLQPFRCALLSSNRKGEKNVIQDIGIDWRERRGIIKEVREGVSIWHH